MNEKFQEMLDLDQKIAEARARVEMEKSLPERGMLSPGIFDYITEGKSDLYKGYYDAVSAREMQDAQMANQRLMQERQLENALRLAQESRAAQQDKINSDNEKSYQLAKNRLDFAKAMHEKAVAEGDRVGILNAEEALNKATIEYNDTLKLTGRQPEPIPEREPFDIRKTADYHLGMTKNINSQNNTIDEIKAAQEQIGQFQTKEAIARYADLELERQKAEKAMANNAAINNAIASFDSATGEIPVLLQNLGWKSELRSGKYALLDSKGNIVTVKKSPKKSPKKPSDDDKDWN